MTKMTLAAAGAGFVVAIGPLLAMSATAQSENLKLAQTVQAPGVQVGPGGVTIGTKPKCRTVTTTVETPDGRKTTKKERRCEGE